MAVQHVVSDEIFGMISRRFWEIQSRILQGELDPQKVYSDLESILAQEIPDDNCREFFIQMRKGRSILERIREGNYDWIHPDITGEEVLGNYNGLEHRDGVEKLILLRWPGIKTLQELQEEFADKNLRPATFTELLAFGAQYPDVQRRYTVITTCLVLRAPDHDLDLTRTLVLALKMEDGRRFLGFEFVGKTLPPHARYLAAEV